MTRHAGTSMLLSVLIVVFFAVALYPHKPASQPSLATRSITRSTDPPPPSAQPAPSPTPGIPLPDLAEGASPPSVARSEAPTAPGPKRFASAGRDAVTRSSTFRPAERPRTVANTSGSATSAVPVETPRPGRAAFTHSVAGETLADVAVRVYGSPDSTRTLWMVNRDVIDGPNSVLVAGTLLRTP